MRPLAVGHGTSGYTCQLYGFENQNTQVKMGNAVGFLMPIRIRTALRLLFTGCRNLGGTDAA